MISLLLLLLKLQSLLQLTVSSSSFQGAPPIAKPDCQDQCGEVRIPYPFGIGASCCHNESYEVICNASFHPPKLFLHRFNLEVMDINWSGRYGGYYTDKETTEQILVVGNIHHNICNSRKGDVAKTPFNRNIDLRGSPYRFSGWYNVFVVEGCGANVVLKNGYGDIITGCTSICTNDTSKKNMTNCNGVGCCQATLLSSPTDGYIEKSTTAGLDYYKIDSYYESLSNTPICNVTAGLLDIRSLTKFSGKLSSLETFPTVLEWGIASPKSSHNIVCDGGYSSCQCNFPYEGNPYIPNGCRLIRECQKCNHDCASNQTHGNVKHYYCEKHHHQMFNLGSILGFSISTGSVILLLVCYWLYRMIKRIKEVKQKAEFFRRNGGLLLQQQISSREGIVGKGRIFGFCELEKATNNFSKDRILGQGGQGTVFKGMLVDGRIVAIKISKKVDKIQLEQFINEMVILSVVDHRNVVKLLGCCLETEVPYLVYEFIPNGTLQQLIHDPSEDFHVTWIMRLQIASESACAVAYLHSSCSAPIYHRDIKTSNILLDDKYRAKVSDFGTSRAITIEQTHVTTCVQGTYGYLDPEYFQSNQFSEKSDVYSFGVVLAELITGKKAIFPNKYGGWTSLAAEFLFHMENSRLSDILDTHIYEEAKEEEFIAVANLARQCLNLNGKQRPPMKEVAVVLEQIRSPYASKPRQAECLESECVVMEYDCPFSTDSSLLENSSNTSFYTEALPLLASS
ncbi:hypothetical protein SOVF_001490 [Spinacia oleracea]|nr:hypothetical protein SOVF_001490 [Spinacia oleracea]